MTASTPTLTVAPESFESLAPAWTELARGLARPIPFHHPLWHQAWWQHFGDGRTPIALAVREGEALRGVVPLMLAGDTLTLAGDPEICDYTDLPVAEDGVGQLTGIFDAVDALEWRTFHIWGLPEEAPALEAARAWAEARGYNAELDFEAVCPRVTLPADWESYLGSLSKKDRHELKRKLRRFMEAGQEVRFRTLSAPEEIEAALPAFFHLHRVSRHDKREFMTEAMEGFFRQMAADLAAEGLLRLFLIEIDGVPAAALIAFASGDELLLYNSGYDPAFAHASVGLISKALTLQAAIESGLGTYDFLRGAEPYKYDLGATDRIVRQLWITRHV